MIDCRWRMNSKFYFCVNKKCTPFVIETFFWVMLDNNEPYLWKVFVDVDFHAMFGLAHTYRYQKITSS